jgi:hypothetical protein
MMQLAFFAWALGYCALLAAIRPRLRSRSGRLGTALLLASAAGLVIAGVFTTDPVTTHGTAATTSGKLHAFGGMLGTLMPAAVALVTWNLVRSPAWSQARRALGVAAGAALAGFLVSFVWMGVLLSGSGGAFGPDVPVGWPNRLEVLLYCVWLLVAAWQAGRIESPVRAPNPAPAGRSLAVGDA